MIETKTRTHTTRLFAEHTSFWDMFKIVVYFRYRGDISEVPWWYCKRKAHSCVIDLTKSLDEILSGMKSNTRNEIRRAEREGCTFKVADNYDEFIQMYNSFCRSKNLNDFTDESRMKKYDHLLITKAERNGKTLAMHSTILDVDGGRSMLQFSCSPRLEDGIDAKVIGWANRFLHFKDLEWLKENGFSSYDWSGVCVDPENPAYSIGKFKLSFGGSGVYEDWILLSPLYVAAEKTREFVRRFMRLIKIIGRRK